MHGAPGRGAGCAKAMTAIEVASSSATMEFTAGDCIEYNIAQLISYNARGEENERSRKALWRIEGTVELKVKLNELKNKLTRGASCPDAYAQFI